MNSALSVFSARSGFTARTEPSANSALNTFWPPAGTIFGSGFFGSNGKSPGFAHGTSSSVSITITVLDNPSVKSTILSFLPASNAAPGPLIPR